MSYAIKVTLPLPSWRSRLLLGLMLLWFLALAGRALYLQVLNEGFLQREGNARYSRVIEISAHRGMITDRWGKPLAISTPVESVWASPPDVEVGKVRLRQLSRYLDMPVKQIKGRLSEKGREFVYLKRQLPPEQAAKVAGLKIPGIYLKREYRRYYPAGEVMAHVLGFTNIDDNGQEGLELAFQSWLAGTPGSRRVIKDRMGHIVEDVESIKTPKEGRNLTLSIDRNIQYLAYRELKSEVAQSRAKAGSIVVLNAKTGEVLALANVPSFNPNNRDRLEGARIRNRAVTDSYEPGSTMKPFTVAAALQAGEVKPNTEIDTGPGSLTIGKWTIHDDHPEGVLTVARVIQVSSNVGAAKMALGLAPKYMWRMLHREGFGTVPDSGFPGEASGTLRPYREWRPIEQATMAYGAGISVSLLQLARAYTIFADNGQLMPLTFLKRDTPAVGRQVISPATARAVRRMLELVVEPGGTAPRARVVGYQVAGKTGTAHKLAASGHYSATRFVASFVGMAPASDPRLIVAVMIDEPSGPRYYGGQVAAPVFSRVMAGALRLMGIPPDAPVNRDLTPPGGVRTAKEMT